MVKKKVWEGILIIIILAAALLTIWYYMSFTNHPVPSRGVYVLNTTEIKYREKDYAYLYKTV